MIRDRVWRVVCQQAFLAGSRPSLSGTKASAADLRKRSNTTFGLCAHGRSSLPSRRPSGAVSRACHHRRWAGVCARLSANIASLGGLCLKDAGLDQQPWSPRAGHGPDRHASRRPPSSRSSAWRPSECLATIRVRACPPAGRCHSDGPLSLGSPATSDTPRNYSSRSADENALDRFLAVRGDQHQHLVARPQDGVTTGHHDLFVAQDGNHRGVTRETEIDDLLVGRR